MMYQQMSQVSPSQHVILFVGLGELQLPPQPLPWFFTLQTDQ